MFALHVIESSDIRDLDFCNESGRLLKAMSSKLHNGRLSTSDKRLLHQLLNDLVLFLLGKEEEPWHDPLEIKGKPVLIRQKLMREQDVLKETFAVLKVRVVKLCD